MPPGGFHSGGAGCEAGDSDKSFLTSGGRLKRSAGMSTLCSMVSVVNVSSMPAILWTTVHA